MKFTSTRGQSGELDFSAALSAGLAPDGGLFVPRHLPGLKPEDFDGLYSLADIATRLLSPFLAQDVLGEQLAEICAQAFDFATPLVPFTDEQTYLLELFHGPTAAFKDIGARFLAECVGRLARRSGDTVTILVATSGDTGAAVAAAFHRMPGVRVVVLYPDGRVSPRQAHQLGCFGDNVSSFAVQGSFDDCQAMAKQALADPALHRELRLTSANSISLGRLLPQMLYYAQASLAHHRQVGNPLNFVVPTGNLGNAMAAALARVMGLPIGRIFLSSNANSVLPEFFAGAPYRPRASIRTLANAMDVGAPSNFERLQWLFPDQVQLRATFDARSTDDAAIADTIASTWLCHGRAICPHTATAVHALEQLRPEDRTGHWAVVATAHPAKFETVVEPLIGCRVELPPALERMLARPARAEQIDADFAELRVRLRRLPA